MSRRDARGARGVRGGNIASAAEALEAARSEAVDALSECFAHDLISMEEFEHRVGLVHGAGTAEELMQATDGLPGAASGLGEGTGVRASADASAAPVPDTPAGPIRSTRSSSFQRDPHGQNFPAARAGAAASDPHPAESQEDTPLSQRRIREFDRSVAAFGETKRVGKWVPARTTQVVTFMGSAVIDLREALMLPGDYSVSAWAVFGSVELIVPPGVVVECAGSAVFGSFEQRDETVPSLSPQSTVVRADGLSVFGSVEVAVRYPGESKRDARRRRRQEKKRRKRLGAPR